MSFSHFAHNGIDHTNSVEATTHQSYTFLWVLVAIAVSVALLYSVRRFLGRQPEEAEEEDNEW
jgi:beta-lactamase regulating signal transducer with metallopeptidase domain